MSSMENRVAALNFAQTLLRAGDLTRADKVLADLRGEITLLEADWKGVPSEGLPPELIMYPWYLGILRRKQGKAKESVASLQVAVSRLESRDDILNLSRILLDYGLSLCGLGWNEDPVKNLELAQSTWERAADLAERATAWDTAAKARKNRAVLLAVSDKPHLSAPEMKRAKDFFQRAGDTKGLERALAFETASPDEKKSIALGLGRS